MGFSSYQLERMLQAFRRLHGLWPKAGATDQEQVSLSESAQVLAQAAGQPTGLRLPQANLSPETPQDPIVDAERERRAASFMNPAPLTPAPPAIPKVRPK